MKSPTAPVEETRHLDPAEDLHREFDLARREVVAARRAQQHKDTPQARVLVEERLALVDTVLDMWNDAVAAR